MGSWNNHKLLWAKASGVLVGILVVGGVICLTVV